MQQNDTYGEREGIFELALMVKGSAVVCQEAVDYMRATGRISPEYGSNFVSDSLSQFQALQPALAQARKISKNPESFKKLDELDKVLIDAIKNCEEILANSGD